MFKPVPNPLPCFKCGKELQSALGETPGFLPNQPSGGVSFSTTGNYGSTVYDRLDSRSSYRKLELTICDECLVAGWAATREIRIRESRQFTVARSSGQSYGDYVVKMRARWDDEKEKQD